MELGCGVYAQAKCDSSRVIVQTGVPGLLLEFSPSEAQAYIAQRLPLLQQRAEQLSVQASEVRAHIHTVYSKQFLDALEILKT